MTAFAGLRVLDLSRVLAGPFCGQMFADFGADVVKVEAREGDENRRWEPVVGDGSANFASVNRGKRAMTLDLKCPEAQALLERLVARSDVLIDSFLPATAHRLGLDHARLRGINPRLIQVSISGYGDAGAWRNRPGYDNMLQAFTGMMAMTGERDGGPCRAGASFIDMATGSFAFAGASAALYALKAGHAQGQHVKVSLLETGMAMLGYHVTGYTMAGKLPTREGSGVWHIVPYESFETASGPLLVGATNDAAWRKLCHALEAPALAAETRFATIAGRLAHRAAVVAAVADILRRESRETWIARFDAAGVPCAPLNELPEALSHPQVAATEMLVDVPDGRGGSLRLVGVPVKMSETPGRVGARPPGVGEHTDEILGGWLGLDAAEVERLRAAGAI